MKQSTGKMTKRFSPRATLAALGVKLNSINLLAHQ
jgi:hypothetical protein